MFWCEDTQIAAIAVHRVGNAVDDEGGLMISSGTPDMDDATREAMMCFLFSSFKYDEYYHFYAEDGMSNGVQLSVSSILGSDELLYPQSVLLAKSLYAKCRSEKIPKGEFYVVKFRNCAYQGQLVDAVGLFKAEKKEVFMSVHAEGDSLQVQAQEGSLINKIDKGCLVLDTQATNGYVVAAFDNGKGENGLYWIDEFLGLRQMENEFFQTQKTIELCNDFVRNVLPEKFEGVTKDQQAVLLNRSVEFFKENEDFSLEDYVGDVLQNEQAGQELKAFKAESERIGHYQLESDFKISDTALKKQAKILKSVIKLDKNFHVYVHGKRDFIVRGFDNDKQMQFYQLFFNEED